MDSATDMPIQQAQQSARNAMDIMVREIKVAGFPKASYPDSGQNLTGANSNKVAAGDITINATNLVFEANGGILLSLSTMLTHRTAT